MTIVSAFFGRKQFFFNERKRLRQIGQNVQRNMLANAFSASFDETTGQKTELFQRIKTALLQF